MRLGHLPTAGPASGKAEHRVRRVERDVHNGALPGGEAFLLAGPGGER